MILLDIIIGHFLPSIFGWVFLAFVILSEGLLLSKYLTKIWLHITIFLSAISSNLITTIIGYYLLDEKSNGGHLLNWIPVYHHYGDIDVPAVLLLLISTLIGSIIIESFFNYLILKRHFDGKKIFRGTLVVNLFTYLIGGLVILFYYNFIF